MKLPNILPILSIIFAVALSLSAVAVLGEPANAAPAPLSAEKSAEISVIGIAKAEKTPAALDLDKIEELINKPLSVNQIWNVNFPGCSLSECKGVLHDRKVAVEGFFNDHYIESVISDDRISYMVEGVRNYSTSDDTDLKAVIENYVSIGIATNIS